jgi:Tfp pilus assembly protein PilN
MRAVNLIPSEQRSGGAVGARSEGAAFAVLVLLAGLAGLAGLYGMAHHQLASRRAEAAALTLRAQQAQVQASRLASYTSFVAMREQRLRAISQLVGSRFDWSAAMGELSRVLPSDVSLSTLQGTVGSTTAGSKAPSPSTAVSAAPSSSASSASAGAASAAPVSATPPGATPIFTLTGCATSQSVVAQTLVRLRLISGVVNVNLQSSTKSTSGGGGSSGSCPSGDPAFSVQVGFNPLPAPPSSSIQALESTSAPASGGAGAAAQRAVSSGSRGASR